MNAHHLAWHEMGGAENTKIARQLQAVEKSVADTSAPNSATGTRTRVARVRAEYPNQLDYSGF
jgi:hypothetical protein